MAPEEVAFAAYGLAWQAALLAFFAARRWRQPLARPTGGLAYAIGGLGLLLGAWLALGDPPRWGLVIGPVLAAGWALLGWWVDLRHPRQWRGPPIEWRVLLPYVGLYFWAQMCLWWPLWDIERAVWAVFLLLFVANTALNLAGHRRTERSASESSGPTGADRG